MKPFRERGIWWLPKNPDDERAGELSFSQDEDLRLSLDGHFDEAGELTHLPSYEPMHGSLGNRIVTLARCRVTGRKPGMPGYTRTSLIARIAAFDILLDTVNAFASSDVAVAFVHLRDWVNRSGVTTILETDQVDQLRRFAIEYTYPQPIQASFADMSVVIQPTAETTRLPLREHGIKEGFRIRASSADSKSPDHGLLKSSCPISAY